MREDYLCVSVVLFQGIDLIYYLLYMYYSTLVVPQYYMSHWAVQVLGTPSRCGSHLCDIVIYLI